MPARKVGLLDGAPADLATAFAEVRSQLHVPADFPPAVLAAAERAGRDVRLPDLDRTDLDLITIDPEGARDLDQAMHIARHGQGYLLSYAIADVAAFVSPGDPVDLEAQQRVMTLYAPDRRTPLHPPVLSEGVASLLPGEVRPALLWTITLDERGQMTDADVRRARVRSREALSYPEAQREIDSGTARSTLQLLAQLGPWREQRERERGGVSLDLPEQEFVADPAGGWRLEYRAPLPVEGWNAQMSLLTGMAAAHLMLYAQVGVLRTMPPADHDSVRRLRQTARALAIAWPSELDYPEFVRALDPSKPAHAAMLNACTSLFRGAGYQAFNGGVPENAEHAALAIDYAHVTAPLRRLVDRYTGEICVALCADQPVPEWVLRSLETLPATMSAGERRAKRYERSITDLLEVCLLQDRVGETFTGTVIEVDKERRRGQVMLADPAVEATLSGTGLPLGQEVQVRLLAAQFSDRAVRFGLAEEPAPVGAAVPG